MWYHLQQLCSYNQTYSEQESIPVGCVLTARSGRHFGNAAGQQPPAYLNPGYLRPRYPTPPIPYPPRRILVPVIHYLPERTWNKRYPTPLWTDRPLWKHYLRLAVGKYLSASVLLGNWQIHSLLAMPWEGISVISE